MAARNHAAGVMNGMATARTRIVPAWPGHSRLFVLLAVGAALAIVNRLGKPWLTYVRFKTLPGGMRYPEAWEIGLFATVFAIIPAILVWLSWREQRPSRAFWEAVYLAGGFIAAYSAWMGDDALHPVFVLVAAIYMGLCVLVRLAALWVVRTRFVRLVENAGTLCLTCGYDLTGNVSGICPECGRPVELENNRLVGSAGQKEQG